MRQRNLIPYPGSQYYLAILINHAIKKDRSRRKACATGSVLCECIDTNRGEEMWTEKNSEGAGGGGGCWGRVCSLLSSSFFPPPILLRAELHISWHRPHDLNAWNRLTLFSKMQLVLLLRILGGGVPPRCAARFSKSWPDFRPKNVIFYPLFHTRSLKSIPVFRPGH